MQFSVLALGFSVLGDSMGWGQRGLRAHPGTPIPHPFPAQPPKPTLVSSTTRSASLGQLSSSTRSLGHGRAGATVLCEGQEPAQGTHCHHWGAGSCPSPLPRHPTLRAPRCPPRPPVPGPGQSQPRAPGTLVTAVTISVQLSPAAPHLGTQPVQLHQGGHGVVEQEQDAGVGIDRPGVAGVEFQGVGLRAVVVQDDVLEAKHPEGTEEVTLTPQPGP